MADMNMNRGRGSKSAKLLLLFHTPGLAAVQLTTASSGACGATTYGYFESDPMSGFLPPYRPVCGWLR
jgi:hypothetical protein